MTLPIFNASGCLDALTAPSVAQALDAFVTKTVTPLPREGNPPPRIAETEHGMINSIGLQNPGIEAFLEHVLPRLSALGVPIWVSVGGFSAADYASTCELLDARDDVATIELNLSCPNVEEAPEASAELVQAARAATRKPLYAKLSPATWDIAENARAVVDAGADGLSLVNTIRGLALDPRTRAPRLGEGSRRLLGPRPEADRPCLRPRLRVGRLGAHRRHGRRCLRCRREEFFVRRRERGRARHGPLLGPGRAREGPARARRRGRGRGGRRSGRGNPGSSPPSAVCRLVCRSDNLKIPANSAKSSRLTRSAMVLDSCGSWSRRRRTPRRPPVRSTSEWKRSKGQTT